MSMPWLGSARSLEVHVRRLLVAGFAALAVLLGLVATTGVASAAPGDHHNCGWNKHWVPAPTTADPNAGSCVADAPGTGHGPGNGNPGGPWGGPGGNHNPGHVGGPWHPGLPWGGAPTMYGHQLWLNANLGLDICGDTSYDRFLSRNMVHRSDIDRYLGRARWQTLYSSDCNSSLAVIPGGLTLVNGNLLNLSLLGLSDAGTVNVCSYPDWTTLNSRFGSRYGSRWDSVRNRFGGNAFNVYRQLRVNARCTTVMVPSSTTIVPQPNTVYNASPTTDPTGNEAASDPAPAASLPAIAPAKAPSAGGWDSASLLAHARVV